MADKSAKLIVEIVQDVIARTVAIPQGEKAYATAHQLLNKLVHSDVRIIGQIVPTRNYVHIQFLFSPEKEPAFLEMVKDFCGERGFAFKEPEKEKKGKDA